MNRAYYVLLALGLGLIVAALLREPATQQSPTLAAAEKPRYEVRGAQWRSFDSEGELRLRGSAAAIDYYDDDSARMREFEVSIAGREGTPWRATAPEGYAPGGGDTRLQLRGGVEGQGAWPDGVPLQFRTPELWIDAQQETLATEAEVEVLGTLRQGRSRGMRVAGRANQVDLLNDVEIRYVPR
ncbi:LPS export ABC transporter periplasmic protein LptC [Panacagrimonas sp.]|uniref:LPS export ABC transporter periplasmic protein LptC n=1 Tax=Panacagrimonas sp. TaxID=2480088 RepID=UPI003B523043